MEQISTKKVLTTFAYTMPKEQIRINRYLLRITPKICDVLFILCIAFDFINFPFFAQIISIVMNFKFVKYWLLYFQEAFSMLIHYNGLLIVMGFKININGVLKAQVANLRQQSRSISLHFTRTNKAFLYPVSNFNQKVFKSSKSSLILSLNMLRVFVFIRLFVRR